MSPAVASLEAVFAHLIVHADCSYVLMIEGGTSSYSTPRSMPLRFSSYSIHQDWTGSSVGSSATATPEYMPMLMVAGCFQLLARLALTAVSMVYVVCVQRSR